MTAIALTDLDGVHFQPRQACPQGAELTIAALGETGAPSSFMTRKQESFLALLLAGCIVVPVTARPTDSFRRVLVAFGGYAICSFGGVILTPDGLPEPTWHEYIANKSSQCTHALAALKKEFEESAAVLQIPLVATVVRDVGCDLYLNCKIGRRSISAQSRLIQRVREILPSHWHLHSNGDNLAAIPPYLGKRQATEHYLTKLAPPRNCVLGLGDSATDLDFIAHCDYAITPTNSQLFALFHRYFPTHFALLAQPAAVG